jgi:hypothetical protein
VPSEHILLQQLTNAGAGTYVGGWYDLSAFAAGAFFLQVVAIGAGNVNVDWEQSCDETEAGLCAIPANQVGQPSSNLSSAGVTEYPLSPTTAATWPTLAYMRVRTVVSAGPVTLNVYFIGRVGLCRTRCQPTSAR